MKTKPSLLHRLSTLLLIACAGAALMFHAAPAGACGDYTSTLLLPTLARQAVSPDETLAARAIAQLRGHGPAGLEALFTTHAMTVRQLQHALYPAALGGEGEPARLVRAIEGVSRQRDGVTSRLYWFTDLEQAKAAAKSAGKPILSLRLLGKLDEEFSCANSRFFRTALYANAELSQHLRDQFVLHWESVRPVPRITIDFGDGRKLERTITGNSIHYVLDAEGRPIDALPGLYGPKAFREALGRARQAAGDFARKEGGGRAEFLRDYHNARLAAIQADWNRDLAQISPAPAVATPVISPTLNLGLPTNHPPAAVAARDARGKSVVEIPMLQSMAWRPALDFTALENATTDAQWERIAALHRADSKLDAASKRLMFRKLDAHAAGRFAISKAGIEHSLLGMAAPFERSMSEDTVRNEYLLHAKIHQWFAASEPATRAVAALNERVYAELFLTPSSDPWLGLKPADAYAALEGDGVVAAKGK